MAKYGILESTNMASTRGAARIYDCVSTVDLENGVVGYLNGLHTGETQTYDFALGVSAGAVHVIIDQPAWNYDEGSAINQRKDQNKIAAGTKFRVRVLVLNDEFGINDVGVTAATKAAFVAGTSTYLTVDGTTGKFVAAATAATTPVLECTFIRKRLSGTTNVTAGSATYGYSDYIYEVKVTTI